MIHIHKESAFGREDDSSLILSLSKTENLSFKIPNFFFQTANLQLLIQGALLEEFQQSSPLV